jgi:seryl-tRNA synthetase
MSELEIVKHYTEEIQRLKGELSEARKEAANYRSDRSGKLKTAESQLAELQAELEKTREEKTSLAKKLETLPTEQQGEIDRLKGEIRQRDHRAKFSDVAKELKASPEALDALWKLSDYEAVDDEVDVEKLKTVIGETLEKNPFLKGAGAEKPVFQPGPGAGQGTKATNPAGSFRMSYEQGRDPVYQKENRSQIREAARRGLLQIDPPTDRGFEG